MANVQAAPNMSSYEANESEHAEMLYDDIVNLPLKMSPVQIQQEYFENLGDCDWVRYVFSSLFKFVKP